MVTAELQTVNVAYFQIKIQLSGLSAYPDGSPSQLIRVSGVLLWTKGPMKTDKTFHSCTKQPNNSHLAHLFIPSFQTFPSHLHSVFTDSAVLTGGGLQDSEMFV
jgi:hypothetical protein